MLFNRSIRENIALADPGMPLERVIEAAKLAGAHEFILELPRGLRHDGRRARRVALGRAAPAHRHRPRAGRQSAHPRSSMRRPARSTMRASASSRTTCARSAAGRTVMIIAHRLSTVRRADRIITIERGRIVEDGTHDELIAHRRPLCRAASPAGRRMPMKSLSSARRSPRRLARGSRAAEARGREARARIPAGRARDHRDAGLARSGRAIALRPSWRCSCVALAWAVARQGRHHRHRAQAGSCPRPDQGDAALRDRGGARDPSP